MSHPDEGTIHAWLDGALSPAERQAFEAHVADCAECTAAVADARGVLAAASRILSALDNVPAGVIPGATVGSPTQASASAREAPHPGRFRAARWRAAAAIVIVAGASWLVVNQRARDVADVRQEAGEMQMAFDSTITPPVSGRDTERVADAAAPSAARAKVMAPSSPMRAAQTRQNVGDVSGLVAGVTKQSAAAQAANSSDALHQQESLRREVAETRSANAPPNAPSSVATNRALPESTASTSAQAGAAVLGYSGAGAARDMARPDRATTIVVDRAYVDSVLAADSADTPPGFMLRKQIAAGEAKVRANAQAPASSSVERLRRLEDITSSAVGCYTLDTTAWLPRSRGETEPISLVPARIELLLDRGLSGDEWGNRLARPAPGEPPLPAGAVAFWKPLGGNKVRVMLADNSSWVSLTLVVGPDSITGPARAFSAATNHLRNAQVTGRRVLCRTEP
jgi:hypothetical protein